MGEIKGADLKALENIIIQHYQEFSFTGKGVKIGDNKSSICSNNPFNILLKRHHELIPKVDSDFPVGCEIIFKFSDGNMIKGEFMTNDTIETLHNFIKERNQNRDFKLANIYPRKYRIR